MGRLPGVEAIGLDRLPPVRARSQYGALVAAVGDLRGAIEIRNLTLAQSIRAGIDLGGQRDGSRGEDEGGDQGLGEQSTSPLVLGRAWSNTKPLAAPVILRTARSLCEVGHAGSTGF